MWWLLLVLGVVAVGCIIWSALIVSARADADAERMERERKE